MYHTSLSPDPNTVAVSLFLYADAAVPSTGTTVSEYASVRAVEVRAAPNFALLASPEATEVSAQRLVVLHNSFSSQWGLPNGRHVMVDGMLNAWLVSDGPDSAAPSYGPAGLFEAAGWISVATTLAIVLWLFIWCLIRAYRMSRASQ
jgi:hypothetical protein